MRARRFWVELIDENDNSVAEYVSVVHEEDDEPLHDVEIRWRLTDEFLSMLTYREMTDEGS